MKYINIFKLFLLLSFVLINASYTSAQSKRALLVGISNYSSNPHTQWSDINGVNDINIISSDLQKQGFQNIVTLLDQNATSKNIKQCLEDLVMACNKDDVVYFHFSGHGQPVLDINGDEGDGDEWDESIIPYDAYMMYEKDIYDGKNHITDDQLNYYFGKIRQAIGSNGFLYVIIDACYSGTLMRSPEIGNIDTFKEIDIHAPIRGINIGFDFGKDKIFKPVIDNSSFHRIESKKGYSNMIALEACQATQNVREIKVDGIYYGPLSFYVHKALLTNYISNNYLWIENVVELYRSDKRNYKQKIVCESTIDNGRGY